MRIEGRRLWRRPFSLRTQQRDRPTMSVGPTELNALTTPGDNRAIPCATLDTRTSRMVRARFGIEMGRETGGPR